MRGDFTPPAVVGDVDERPDECARGVGSANGARRAVPAAKASGRYRFGEGTFPRIPDNDGGSAGSGQSRQQRNRAAAKQSASAMLCSPLECRDLFVKL